MAACIFCGEKKGHGDKPCPLMSYRLSEARERKKRAETIARVAEEVTRRLEDDADVRAANAALDELSRHSQSYGHPETPPKEVMPDEPPDPAVHKAVADPPKKRRGRPPKNRAG